MTADTPTTTRTVILEWAQISGAVAQVLMLFVIAGGYYFTVHPLFQNQLLSEKAAELEVKVGRKEAELSAMEASIEAGKRTIEKYEEREAQLINAIALAKLDSERVLWERFRDQLLEKSEFKGVRSIGRIDATSYPDNIPSFRRTAELDPYWQVMEAAHDLEEHIEFGAYPVEMYEYLRTYMDEIRADLDRCTKFDLDDLDAQFREDVQAEIEANPTDLEDSIIALYNEYANIIGADVHDCEQEREDAIHAVFGRYILRYEHQKANLVLP